MKTAIIALDYTAMDDFIMLNSRSILDRCGVTDISFVHVVPNYLNINNLNIDSPTLGKKPIDKLVATLIKKKISKHYGGQGGKYNSKCVILEGSPYTQLINYIKTNPTDLLITGKKHRSKGSGVTARRIAHHVACNVLFITEDVDAMFDKIGVPIDFSNNSVRALKQAISIAKDNTKIQPVHVISHAPSDHYLGLNHNTKYRSMYLNTAKNEYFNLLKKSKIDQTKILDMVYLEDSTNNISHHLREFFLSEKIDLAIMGAKGHNALDSILYGSVAEKFVDNNDVFPTMIIR